MDKNETAQRAQWKAGARYLFAAITLLGSCLFAPAAKATLIMVLRHGHNEIYMASDGVISSTDGSMSEKHIKCFPTSDTSCVGLAGFSGTHFTFTNTDTTRQSTMHSQLLLELDYMSSEQVASHQSFLQSVTNITTRFLDRHNLLMQLKDKSAQNDRTQLGPTLLVFIGYDSNTATYINATARFSPTNSTEAVLEIDPIPPSYLSISGVPDFLLSTLSGKNPNLASVMPKALHERFVELASTDKPLDMPTVNTTILQLFSFHKRYAKQFGYNDGNVGSPYVIYRINTTNVSRVYYGDGGMDSDDSIVGIIVGAIVFILIVGIVVIAFKG